MTRAYSSVHRPSSGEELRPQRRNSGIFNGWEPPLHSSPALAWCESSTVVSPHLQVAQKESWNPRATWVVRWESLQWLLQTPLNTAQGIIRVMDISEDASVGGGNWGPSARPLEQGCNPGEERELWQIDRNYVFSTPGRVHILSQIQEKKVRYLALLHLRTKFYTF